MAVDSSGGFDLIVLGGGYSVAFRASQLGLQVALVDQDKVGRTCLHVGCIPTKAMLESAELFARLKRAGEFGTALEPPSLNYAQIAARRDQIVRRMWTGLKGLVDKNRVAYVAGRGRLDGPSTIRVALPGEDGTPGAGGQRILHAENVILATGSRIRSLPGLTPDGRQIITSDDVTTKAELPKSVMIVGAGAVGSEFAWMYSDLGVAVTLLEYLPAIVLLEDRDVSRELERTFRRRGIRVMTKARFNPAAVHKSVRKASASRWARRAPLRRRSEPSRCCWRPAALPTSLISASRRRGLR